MVVIVDSSVWAAKGLKLTLPDAHVAQCALDLDAVLLTRDEVFQQIATHTSLRLRPKADPPR